MEYEIEKKKCEELAEDVYNKVNGAIDINSITYAIYPKISNNLEIRKPSWYTVRDWVTNVWQRNKWKNKREEFAPLVYGIINDNRLVYVGKTVRGLELREYEHKADSNSRVGRYLCDNPDCKFVILAIGESDYEVSLMKKRIIEVCKPLLNKEEKINGLSDKGQKEKYNKYAEMVKEVDDIHMFLDLWIVREQIELWKMEDVGTVLGGLDKLSGEDIEVE